MQSTTPSPAWHEQMNQRRRVIGMTYEALGMRCGVPVSTIKRLLTRGIEHASLAKVVAIAEALGMSLSLEATTDEVEFRETQALRKAHQLVRLTQGTSALESQGLSEEALARMTRQTVHDLMAGSPKRLWD